MTCEARPDLKPCPFCGEQPRPCRSGVARWEPGGVPVYDWFAECGTRDCAMFNDPVLAEKWNRRAGDERAA